MAGKIAKRNIGGGTWYSGGGSKVAAEAKERKDGGKVTATAAKRKFGGRTVGSPSGAKSSSNLGKRARGGRLANLGHYAHGGACDKNPWSSAKK